MCKEEKIVFAIARAYSPIPELIERYGLMEEIGADRLYPTNRAAIQAFYEETGRQAPAGDDADDNL